MVIQHLGTDGIELLRLANANPWKREDKPFAPVEDAENRIWNPQGAQLRMDTGSRGVPLHQEDNSAPDAAVFDPIVQYSPECQRMGISSGEQYLYLWAAMMFTDPERRLPHLALVGPHNGIKSSIINLLRALLLSHGSVVDLVPPLRSQDNRLLPLVGAVVAFNDDADTSISHGDLLGRFKTLVTSQYFSVRPMCCEMIEAKNYLHFHLLRQPPEEHPV